MISKEEVKHIAELARIKLTESQIEKYQKELSGILDFVGQLAEVNTTDVKPIRQIMGLESVFRKDEDRHLIDQNQGPALVKQASEHRDGFVVVPEVIKRDK